MDGETGPIELARREIRRILDEDRSVPRRILRLTEAWKNLNDVTQEDVE